MQITTIAQFIEVATANPAGIYGLFEYDCTDEVRREIYALADDESPEPFRSAMAALGFTNY